MGLELQGEIVSGKIKNMSHQKKDNKKKLHLGCGHEYLKDYLNVDVNKDVGPDMVVDLNKVPWPFENDQFDEVLAKHVFEHLTDPVSKMQELYRITKRNGIFDIRVPHFSHAWANITHVTAFSVRTFDFLDARSTLQNPKKEFYGTAKFEVIEKKLSWIVFISKNRIFLRLFNKIINFFANKDPYFCERIWCYWVGGFEEIRFKVKVIK